jgi:hypothetical protein
LIICINEKELILNRYQDNQVNQEKWQSDFIFSFS